MSVNKSLQGTVLYDANGNEMAVEHGEVAVATVRGLLTQGTDEVDKARRISAVADGNLWRLSVDAKTVVVTTQQIIALLEKSGGGSALHDENGSTTPVPFFFGADATKDIHLQSLSVCMSSTSIDLDGTKFASGNYLPNGLLVRATVNDGQTIDPITNFTINEDFRRLLMADLAQGSVNDNMTGIIQFGGDMILKAGSSDKLEVVVRDNLTTPLLGLHYLTATLYAIKEA
jgi:hypothetical protein